MHSSSVIQWALYALFPVVGRAALDCRPEGPVRPRPSSLHTSNIFKDAGGNLTTILSNAISGSIKTGWPVENLSFSIGLVSYDQPDAAAPIWEYHHLGKKNERGTKKLDKNSQYLIGSITKVISAYILMKSDINIDAPVTDFLPELTSPSSHIHWEDVSLKMLASHLSGAPTNCELA
jgi:actin-related protein 6